MCKLAQHFHVLNIDMGAAISSMSDRICNFKALWAFGATGIATHLTASTEYKKRVGIGVQERFDRTKCIGTSTEEGMIPLIHFLQ